MEINLKNIKISELFDNEDYCLLNFKYMQHHFIQITFENLIAKEKKNKIIIIELPIVVFNSYIRNVKNQENIKKWNSFLISSKN